MKIRTAIFGTYAIASAVGLAVLMRFVLAEVRPRYVSSLQRTMNESAHLVAEALATRPFADWPKTFEALATVQTGIRLEVVDAEGETLFDSQPHLAAEIAAEYSYKRYQSAKNRLSMAIDSEPFVTEGWLQVVADVEAEREQLGRVTLSRPLRTVNAFIWSERKKLATGAILVSLVMLGLGWWLANKLTSSLERLAAYATAVRDGRSAEPPPSRATEIAAVGDAFEGMRRALEGKDYVEHYTHNLAHELKAPLSGIRGAAELMQEQAMPEADRRKFLANIRTESDRLHGIVDRMLRLTSLEAQRGLEEKVPVDLTGVVDEAIGIMSAEAQTKSVTLCKGNCDTNVMVLGERFLLLQAVLNYLQNALAFTPAGSKVTVNVSGGSVPGSRQVRVAVEDEGPGLPDFATGKVFDRFYSLPRPDGGRKSTGLGLSFVKEIADLHGGTAGIENRASGGACAWLHLPKAE